MAFKLNYKKTELIRLAEEMGLEISAGAKVIQLKNLIESSDLYRDDIDFVRELMSNIQEEKRDEIELQKLKLSQFEKELELINAKKGLADISQVSETKESSSLTDNLECLIRNIQKMYRQILVEASQRDLQRILWMVGPEEEIVTYRLKTVTYGMSNAPFLAIRTLQQFAQDEKTRFHLASEALLNDTYMDDIVSGAPDIETARRLQSELQDALQSCGMVLHKWSSNSPELLNSSSSSDVEHLPLTAEFDLSVKTLDINWKPLQDCFVF
ncbi:DUF1758 domain-containing protein [Trichonephila clavata]|uniref:DUF1758 domain-containing protein n=1 Tax=Trichonephila clavata TaxID=2740835 RepID=A0A8X6JUJ4_TRICU|nr:DUF1758 domain-containing protein [Trichonephila clavata]